MFSIESIAIVSEYMCYFHMLYSCIDKKANLVWNVICKCCCVDSDKILCARYLQSLKKKKKNGLKIMKNTNIYNHTP